MRRNVTALYQSHEMVDLLRRELEEIGLSHSDVRVIPDAVDEFGVVGLGSPPQPIPSLHELDLPSGDVRAYEERIWRGDVLVSVSVDEDLVSRVEDIMRSPENFTHLHRSHVPGVERHESHSNARLAGAELIGGRGAGDETVLPDPAQSRPRDANRS